MSTATLAHENPALLPERIAPYRLRGIYEMLAEGCREDLYLDLSGAGLSFRADPDTDALEARFEGDDFRLSPNHRPLVGSAFDRFVGAELGWTWSAVNQQGYCDTALLSFGGITPNILVHVIGSSVRVMGLTAAV